MQVNILEAKNRLSQLLKSVQAGEEVIIANRGQPVARLVGAGDAAPAAATSASVGSRRGDVVGWMRTHPLPPYARRSPEEIDAALSEERASWV